MVLTQAEQDNPNEVLGLVDALSKLTARKAELFSGEGKDQKAKAANRSGNRNS